jgi:hypothetical protein
MQPFKTNILLTAGLLISMQAVCSEGQQQSQLAKDAAKSLYCPMLSCWQKSPCPLRDPVDDIVKGLDFTGCLITYNVYGYPSNISLTNKDVMVIGYQNNHITHDGTLHNLDPAHIAHIKASIAKIKQNNSN